MLSHTPFTGRLPRPVSQDDDFGGVFMPFFLLSRPRDVLRHSLPIVALLVCGWLLIQRMSTMDMTVVFVAVTQVSLQQWLLAAIATMCSFQALGRYDAVWHRILGTGIADRTARTSGMCAVAISQLLGFGVVTASLVRWRCLPTLSLWQSTRLSMAVTLTFTFAAAFLATMALWWLAPPAFLLSNVEILAVLGASAVCAYLAHRFAAPQMTIADVSNIMMWTSIDLLLAGSALYILLPYGIDIPFATIIAAYVLALSIGLISNAPGGVGAFDLTLLALLPTATPEPLFATIVAFRIIYYLGPAMIALAAIARPAARADQPNTDCRIWRNVPQNGALGNIGGQPWLLGHLPLVTAALGPAHGPTTDAAKLDILRRTAWRSGTSVALYNCDPRLAHEARKAGWFVRRTAMEGMIRPALWTTAGRKRQTLRRKLRHAESAGVSIIASSDNDHPLREMGRIARAWRISHGGEHGFSMGRYSPQLVAQQRVFLIYDRDKLVGFVTFMTWKEWTLDLIRHSDDIPDGAVQAAIVKAIETARAEKVDHLSLASVPDPRYTPAIWSNRRAGLIQFKRAFQPIWVPRYHAAPTQAGFWFTGAMIGLAIHRPVNNAPWKLARALKIIMQKYQQMVGRWWL